ncbi:hypothetical protein Lfu02_35490 [Longispora fulva]|uniref:Putative Ntn-hydrolase superfamily protein n=1 Tax=Longispora fulva TaxID=619741 RepID=A0A8J7GQV7_9ACTN|nr:DUF1028 domain-containing protein [Longispora fulva]MBG6141668.1 putative Ntn-hydrolase superfamily protein [Longispora fulva]GIG59177.1 hypothetical protein Lfu02_35490 [Longispora fulva]
MTYSIVARSADGVALGVAVASKFLAVGMAVPAAEAGVGALATQAYANLAYRPQGLALLRTGTPAADVVAGLTAADQGREDRQLGVVGPTGSGATYTGKGCFDWAGGVAGDGYAIQGNILTGPEVVAEMERSWLGSADLPFADRLLQALAAGEAAGGDSRGRQSAALYIVSPGGGYGGLSDVAVDLRVDDHRDPVAELARLYVLHDQLFGHTDPELLLSLEGAVAEEVGARLTALGYAVDRGLDAGLAAWAGSANMEERLVEGRIDPVVLEVLRAA